MKPVTICTFLPQGPLSTLIILQLPVRKPPPTSLIVPDSRPQFPTESLTCERPTLTCITLLVIPSVKERLMVDMAVIGADPIDAVSRPLTSLNTPPLKSTVLLRSCARVVDSVVRVACSAVSASSLSCR